MRPAVLDHGYGPAPKMLFRMVRLMSGHPMPDAAKITFYRRDFYGARMSELTQAAMRGPSQWSVADRELMAAYLSGINSCPFCVGAHTATSALAYRDEAKVAAVLADLDSAPIPDGLRETLRLLGRLAAEETITADDVRQVLTTGVTEQQIRDALAVGFAFNVTNRLANAFAFQVLSPQGFRAGAKYLLRRGYGRDRQSKAPAVRN
jgi:uncharacterized peroxidase-related enzyme